MRIGRWLLIFVLLFFGVLAGLGIGDAISVSQIEPYATQEVRKRYDELAKDWHEQAIAEPDELPQLIQKIARDTGAEVTIELVQPYDRLEGIGISNVYFALPEFGGVLIYVYADPPDASKPGEFDQQRALVIGPMPGTFWFALLNFIWPILSISFFCCLVIAFIMRLELAPLQGLSVPRTSEASRHVNYLLKGTATEPAGSEYAWSKRHN